MCFCVLSVGTCHTTGVKALTGGPFQGCALTSGGLPPYCACPSAVVYIVFRVHLGRVLIFYWLHHLGQVTYPLSGPLV